MLLLDRIENACNVAYYPLEHLYWLGLHKIVQMQDKTVNAFGLWSCRFWAAYVLVHFAHLYEEWQLLAAREAHLRQMERERPMARARSSSRSIIPTSGEASGSSNLNENIATLVGGVKNIAKKTGVPPAAHGLVSSSPSKSSASDTEEDKEWKRLSAELRAAKRSWWIDLAVNTAYAPLTIHWSLENSRFPDVGVGLCGTVAAVAQFYTAWKATA